MSQRIINLLRRIVSKLIMSDTVEKIRLVYIVYVIRGLIVQILQQRKHLIIL